MTLHVEPATMLPTPMEWKIHQLQEAAYRLRIDTPDGGEKGRVLVLAGPLGLGAEIVAEETAVWMAQTDLSTSGALFLNMASGCDTAFTTVLGLASGQRDVDVVDDALRARAGPVAAVLFEDVDVARDRQLMTEDECLLLGDLASALVERGHTVIAPMSQALGFSHTLLGAASLVAPLYPMPFHDCEEFVRRDSAVSLETERALLLQLSIWLSAGFGDIVMALKPLPHLDDLRQLVDFLVDGGPLPRIVEDRLSETVLRMTSRFARLEAEASLDSFMPCLAALGSGMTINEPEMVGADIGARSFNAAPRVNREDALASLWRCFVSGLAAMAAPHSVPRGWFIDGRPSAFLLHPFLRPLARRRLGSHETRALDDWTIQWAIDKMNFFSRDYGKRASRPNLQPYIEHAWPLFASAAWLVKRRGDDPAPILGAIDRAMRSGWWPAGIDLAPLFGGVAAVAKSDTVSPENDVLELVLAGVKLQQTGELAQARTVVERALSLVEDDSIRALVFLKLATIVADQGDVALTGELLKKAELAAATFGPLRLRAEIAYEQASLLKRLDRTEDAVRRFNEAIENARKYNIPHMECLSFQELADLKLQVFFVAAQEPPLDLTIAEAEDYIDRAEVAAERGGDTEYEAASHTLLRARVALLRGDRESAKQLGTTATELFRKRGDWREVAGEEFLRRLALLESI